MKEQFVPKIRSVGMKDADPGSSLRKKREWHTDELSTLGQVQPVPYEIFSELIERFPQLVEDKKWHDDFFKYVREMYGPKGKTTKTLTTVHEFISVYKDFLAINNKG